MKFFELSSTTVTTHRNWSDETFGPRSEKGPIGPLKHLKKEVDEVLEDPHEIEEYADLAFLLLDSLHRAGFDCADLDSAMARKMDVLKARVYPKGDPDEPAEHDRDFQPTT